MNLVFLHPHFLYPGGASKYMIEVASRLAKRGIKTTIVLTKYNKKLVKQYKNLKFIEVGRWTTGEIVYWLTIPVFLFKLKKVLDKIPDKVLFPQIFPPVWWAGFYKIFSPDTKVIWMCQEPSAFIHSPLVINSLKRPFNLIALMINPYLKFMDKYLVKKIDYIIGNSKYGQKLILETYGRKADLYAYPSVNPEIYKPQGLKKNYIFTISRLDKQKNVDLLIKAFALLPVSLLSNFQLVIGGDGTEAKNLIVLAKKLNISHKIKFLGRVPEKDLPGIYAEAKLSVFLGENEPFGIIPVESMSCGTPVIALKCGGVVESITDQKTGFLLENKSAKNLAKTITHVLEDEALLDQFSKEARLKIVKNFSWDITSEKIYQFLKSIGD